MKGIPISLKETFKTYDITTKEFANYAGVSQRTIQGWLKKDDSPPYGRKLLGHFLTDFRSYQLLNDTHRILL